MVKIRKGLESAQRDSRRDERHKWPISLRQSAVWLVIISESVKWVLLKEESHGCLWVDSTPFHSSHKIFLGQIRCSET